MTTENQQNPKTNPAEQTGHSPAQAAASAPPRARVPMSVPRAKLQVPDLPGFYLYWFVESSIPEALQAGYTFVTQDEVGKLNQHNPANADGISGNADLGSRVRIYAGVGPAGQPEFFVLMKLPLEYYLDDQREIAKRNGKILEGIFKNEQIYHEEQVKPEDRAQAYVRQDMTSAKIPLFMRRPRKVQG